MLKNRKIPHLNFIIAVILSFLCIKIIDNYKVIISLVNSFISIIAPFIYAFIIAYILNPLMRLFERRFKFKRSISILCTYALIIGVIVVSITVLFPKISDNIADLFKNAPVFAEQTRSWINNFVSNNKILDSLNSKQFFQSNISSLIPNMTNILTQSIDTVFATTISFTNSFVKVIFGFIISIYVLCDKEIFIETIRKFIFITLKKKNGDSFIELFKHIHHMLSLYIGTKAIDSLIIGILCFIGVSLLQSPYALLIAVIVCVTNMIPYFGPFIGMIPAFVINLFYSPIRAVWILIFLFFLQQFDAWYLDPKLIGGKVGLNPFLIIFAVTVGGGLFGVLGMLLGVPTMAVIKIYIDKFLQNYHETKKNICKNTGKGLSR